MLFVTLLDYTYWFTSAALGGIFGSLVPFDTKGIDFVMTSMFIVIFVEQVRQQKTPLTASIGLCSAVICRLLFGPDHFLIPTMIVILILVTGLRKRITQKEAFLHDLF